MLFALAVLATILLAALHFVQQEVLRSSVSVVREVGRANNDLAKGFLHFTLDDGPDSPWQRERGYALLTQALTSFERASRNAQLEPNVAQAFAVELNDFRSLLQHAHAAPPTTADLLALRLALHRLDTRGRQVDDLLLKDLQDLRGSLARMFGFVFIAALLMLLMVYFAMRSSRRETITALRLLDGLASLSTDLIYAKDRRGRYLFCNQEGARLIGRPVREILGKTDAELYPAEQAERFVAHDRRVMEDQRTQTDEEDISTSDGVRTFLSTRGPLLNRGGKVVGAFGVSRDITARKRSEQSLRQSQAQLEAVIDSLNEGLVLATPEGEVLRVNRAVLEFYDCDAPCLGFVDQFRDRMQHATLDGVVLPFEDWPINRVLRGEHLENLELRVTRLDQSWSRIHSFGGRLVHSAEGEPLIALLMMSDVTPRHQAEESLRRTQRMEALGELAAGIAHDFNNVLMAMAGNARLAEEELPPQHAARECLHEIVRASARASDLVRSILLFARAEEPRRRAVPLAPLIDEALALVRPTTPSMVRFRTHAAADAPPVHIDPSQMHQVLVNLITNSVYALVHGPHRAQPLIEITIDQRMLDHTDAKLGLPPGRYALLCIKDNGSGMDEATLAKVFNPFFTTKPTGQGTGLGMSVVHGIVRNHDGAVAVHSRLNEGTSVEIYLPAATQHVELPRAVTTPSTASVGKRVLYLDDEESLVFLAVRYLRKRGHDVTGFIDPLEALRVFRDNPRAFDVIITDMSMPAMSGYEVAQQMLTARPDVKILMLSGYVRPEDRDAALELGVKDLLLKPSSIEDLADAVDRQMA